MVHVPKTDEAQALPSALKAFAGRLTLADVASPCLDQRAWHDRFGSIMKLRRRLLYKVVWTMAVTSLARECGVSDQTISKTCKRYRIPTPPRGYWTQLKADPSLPIEPLPEPQNDEETSLSVNEEIVAQLEALVAERIFPAAAESSLVSPTAALTIDPVSGGSGEEGKVTATSETARVTSTQPAREGLWTDDRADDFDPLRLFDLARKRREIAEAEQFLGQLESAITSKSAGVRALVMLWIAEARQLLETADPLRRLVAFMEHAASQPQTSRSAERSIFANRAR